jgi:hypothetical protein
MDAFDKFTPGNEVEVGLPDGTVVKGELVSVAWHQPQDDAIHCDFKILSDGKVYAASWTYKDEAAGTPPKATSMSQYANDMVAATAYAFGVPPELVSDLTKGDQPAADLTQIVADLEALKAKEPQASMSPLELLAQQDLLPSAMGKSWYASKYAKKPLAETMHDLLWQMGKAMQSAPSEELAEVLTQGLMGMNVPLFPPLTKGDWLHPDASSSTIKILHIKLEVSG